jgi:hypothetical protein
MFSFLRDRLGIPGVISIIALVFAMIGGAYAASNSNEGRAGEGRASEGRADAGRATASAKKAKQGPRGPKGKTGATGPAGPAGAKGDTGAAGANGKDGAPGQQGSQGNEGEPGEPGEPGPEGDPWTAGGTLPPGATEVGAFALHEYGAVEFQSIDTAISFPIPLAEALGEPEVHMVGKAEWNHEGGPPGTVPTACKVSGVEGTPSNPLAQPGHLCVYVAYNEGVHPIPVFTAIEKVVPPPPVKGASTSGAVLLFLKSGGGPAVASGTFAVTGCDPAPGAPEFACP